MRSLRARLATTLGLGLAILIGAGGIFLYLRVRDTLREAFDENLRNRAAALAARLEVDIKPAFRKQITSLGAQALAGGSGDADIEAIRAELLLEQIAVPWIVVQPSGDSPNRPLTG